jgi:dienelactone hydrolase
MTGRGRVVLTGMAIVWSALGWPVHAAAPPLPVTWDTKALSAAPKMTAAPEAGEPGVRGIFYDGLPWQGKPTRVFAWLGLPKGASAANRAPGMVLVHGGGGTAHARWVRLWNDRGYAAIAMDLCGKAYGATDGQGRRHEFSGPSGWDDSFAQMDWPTEDQWQYHAVADILLAHSLLRWMPEVDAARIGLTGISWGGYLVCIVAGVDDRFRFVAPVYGCGFLGEDSCWVGRLQKMEKAKADRWLAQWDPSHYLPRARMPMLWVTGDRDFAYPMGSLQKSYRLPQGDRYLSIRPAMPHGHPQGESPAEIAAFADQVMRGGLPLARCTGQGADGRRAWATFLAKTPMAKAECVFTSDTGPWQKRKWTVQPAAFDADAGKATFDLPEGAAVVYFTATDKRGLLASSEHVTLPTGGSGAVTRHGGLDGRACASDDAPRHGETRG